MPMLGCSANMAMCGRGQLAARTPGAGMASLHERASLLGGRLECISPPRGGTTVLITIPLPS
jgi:signal transduction histidine kinase